MPEKENNAEKKLEEANFNVSSLSEVKDANGNGIFHMRTKTKFILVISILILLSAGALIYLFIEKYIEAEIWQAAIWGLCAILAVYSMFANFLKTYHNLLKKLKQHLPRRLQNLKKSKNPKSKNLNLNLSKKKKKILQQKPCRKIILSRKLNLRKKIISDRICRAFKNRQRKF